MATYTTYSNGETITATGGGNAAGYPAVSVLQNVVDFSKRIVTAADVIQALSIPAHTLVMRVGYEVLVADATQTMTVGDGSDTDGFIVAADVGTLGNSGMSALALTEGAPNTITGYSGGKYYSAADTIDILVPTGKAYDTLKVRIFAIVGLMG